MRFPSGPALFCLSILALSLAPERSFGQDCPSGKISYIFIDNNSIFDLSELDPEADLRWAYSLANKLHVRTREKFILDELLFEVGECLDPLLLEETERLLRAYRFIGDADVFAIPQPDGTQHVNVYTQDEWTTKVDLGLRVDDGVKIEGVEITEENFLGLGILARGFFKKDKEIQDIGFEIETPRLFGTRWDSRVSLGNTRTGNFFEQSITYPFVGEVGRLGARQSFLWRETVFSYSTAGSPDYTHLLLPFLDQRWDVAAGRRFGRPGNLTLLGLGISRESVEFREFPSNLEYIGDKDFSHPLPVDSAGVAEIQGQARSHRANRINLYLAQRSIRFVQRRGLDALRGIQDVGVGTEVFLGLGKAWRGLQEGGSLSSQDLHAQSSVFAGGAWDGWVLNAQASVEGRYGGAQGGGGAGWKDTFAEAALLLYWQPKGERFHTLLLRVSADGGWAVETPFQLTLGGRTALRGYRGEEYPGAHRLLMTLEDRIYLPSPSPGLFDLGLAFFLDVGNMWAGEAPFGMNSGWVGSIGGGVRLALPPSTTNVLRVDLALPLGRKAQLNDLILRISLQELLGILPGLRDRQILRSLRNGVRPTFVALPW
ncbi:MAG: outer membrane protein assembly factor [Longimicrobiales bacterium]|nr:outer membrane protein assembly factor [Longimicrobiales bacterium]